MYEIVPKWERNNPMETTISSQVWAIFPLRLMVFQTPSSQTDLVNFRVCPRAVILGGPVQRPIWRWMLLLIMNEGQKAWAIRQSPYTKDTSSQHRYIPGFKGFHLFNMCKVQNIGEKSYYYHIIIKWSHCYKLIQRFRVTCLFTGQNTTGKLLCKYM